MAKNKPAEAAAAEETPAEELPEAEGVAIDDGGGEGQGLVVNLTDVDESGDFVCLPRGVYPCVLSDLSFEFSKSKGNPMWTWTWEVEEGHEHARRKFFYHTTFNEGGLPRVKKALARIVTDSGYEKELLQTSFDPEKVALEGNLIGARAGVRVDVKPYEGKNRNNVRDVLPPSGVTGGGGEGSFLGS